jgi:hypothetical protein
MDLHVLLVQVSREERDVGGAEAEATQQHT